MENKVNNAKIKNQDLLIYVHCWKNKKLKIKWLIECIFSM